MSKKPSQFDLQSAVDAMARAQGKATEAAKLLDIPRRTFIDRFAEAERQGLQPNKVIKLEPTAYIRKLEAELKAAQAESADAIAVKRIIGDIASKTSSTEPPKWLSPKSFKHGTPGVPTLFLSDLHWGEVVHPSQINNVNKFNLAIAHERMTNTVNVAEHLLRIISPKMEYPGIVIALGGDMISGDIHEELAESNDLHTIPTVLDLWGVLASAIRRAADVYGNVFLPCVSGNHGRNTKKIRAKDRNHTSFDWMLYQLLAKEFENDKRITFLIPDGSDAAYRIYGTRYNLTHGDQFRGGDGMIGALGPIIRGDHKKRSRNGQIDLGYDVLMCGHWHQYMHLTRLIVNGSMKGYDEYAYTNNFGFEPPQQALWLTEADHGITYRMPVYCDRNRKSRIVTDWVSVPKV